MKFIELNEIGNNKKIIINIDKIISIAESCISELECRIIKVDKLGFIYVENKYEDLIDELEVGKV